MPISEFKNLKKHHLALEFNQVLINLSKYAQSELSRLACLEMEFLNTKEQVEYELDLVDEARKIIDDTQNTIPIDDILDINLIFKENVLSAQEIFELAKNLRTSRLSKNFISKQEKNNLVQIANNLYVDKEFEDEIFSIFDSELNLKDSASDVLRSLRNS